MPFIPPMGERPPLVRELISAGGTLPAGVDMALVTAAGQNVIESMSGHIFHFLLSQRQNHKLSGHAVSRTHLEIPPLDLVYETAHGQEMLTINCIVTPEVLGGVGGLAEDINLDGYFAFYYDASYVPGAAGVDLYMNGVKFHTAIIPKGVSCGTIICAFGPTALKCHSLNDKDNLNQKQLFSPVTPALPNVNGVPQLPGYFALNWADPRSPIGPVFTSNSEAAVLAALPGGAGFQVFDCRAKAPASPNASNPIVVVSSFDTKGPNLFEAFIGGTVGADNIYNGGAFAEFFDRSKKRFVSQSWTKRSDAGTPTISVNDMPMFNGNAGYNDAGRAVGLFVDLSQTLDPPLASADDAATALRKIPAIRGRLFVGDYLDSRSMMNVLVQNRSLTIQPGGADPNENNYVLRMYQPSDLTVFPPADGGTIPAGTIQYVQAYQYSLGMQPDPQFPGRLEGVTIATPVPGYYWAIYVPNGMTVEQAQLQSRYRLYGYGV